MSATSRVSERRIVGIDIARCLALLGMMATHIVPGEVDGQVTVLQQVAGGRSSALFAVLAGVSLVLVTGRRTPLVGRPWWAMFAGTVVRALLIAALGLCLGELDTNIAVILAYYGVFFLLAVPFLVLRTRTLLVVTVAWLVLGPVLSFWLRQHLPASSFDVPGLHSLADPVALLRDLLVTGYYPALTWLPYLLAGMVIGRLDLRASASALWLVLVGLAAAVSGWLVSDALTGQPRVVAALLDPFRGPVTREQLDLVLVDGLYGTVPTESAWWLAVRAPHSGTSFDLLVTLGSACLVLAGCLLLGRAVRRWSRVVFGAGAMTLTLYTAHVLSRSEGFWDGRDVGTFLAQVVVVLLVGAAFALAGVRGPLESFVGDLSGAARRLAGGRR